MRLNRLILSAALALSALAVSARADTVSVAGEHIDRTGNRKFSVDRSFFAQLYGRDPGVWAGGGRHALAAVEQTLDLGYIGGPADLGGPKQCIEFRCQPIALGNEGNGNDPEGWVCLSLEFGSQVVISPASAGSSIDARDVPPFLVYLLQNHAHVAVADESFYFRTSIPTSITLDFEASAADADAGGAGQISLKGAVKSEQELFWIWTYGTEADIEIDMGVTLHRGRMVFRLNGTYDGDFGDSYCKLLTSASTVRVGFTVRNEWGIGYTTHVVDDHTPAIRKFLINEAGLGLVGPVLAPSLPTLTSGPVIPY